MKTRTKIHRNQPAICRKVVAFQELLSLGSKKTAREAARILEVPNSSMQSWIAKSSEHQSQELSAFFITPCGSAFLQRTVLAAYHMAHFSSGGIRAIQTFLEDSQLDKFVASSEGALQQFSVRYEEQVIAFGNAQETKLAKAMEGRKISAGLDEIYRSRHPCLVAIEVVSGFILLEKFTEDRTAETWKKELTPRLKQLKVILEQVVSDLCGGIRAYAKMEKANHSPDLFHAQDEISKATAAPMASQERAFKTDLDKAEEALKKVEKKFGVDSNEANEARITRNYKQIGLNARQTRQEKVREAKKELGKIHHPIDIKTGKLQTAEDVKTRFNMQLQIIEDMANEAGLSQSSMKRIEKARRAFDAIVGFVASFFIFYASFVKDLHFEGERKTFFDEVAFPLSYLKMIWRRLNKKVKEELSPLKISLEARFQEAPYPDEEKQRWLESGRECAERFQRSSSAVEGQNGLLSLLHHRLHRLNERSLKALTVVQNFHVKRQDGTTAAERFFRVRTDDLFEFLVGNVRIPGRPQKQHHEANRRAIAWQKRRAA